MKNKRGQVMVWLVVVLLLVAVVGGGALWMNTRESAVQTPSTSGTGTQGQNPAISLAFNDALTGASITAIADNYRNKETGRLIGKSPTFVSGMTVIPLVNASGYVATVQPDYKVVDGNQQITGELYSFVNASVTVFNNLDTGAIGGTMGSVGNDTATTSTINNRIKLSGTSDKSTSRQFVVFEISNTTTMSSVNLIGVSGSAPVGSVASVSVPNCYTNNLTGTPFRQAWEIPAVIDGADAEYKIQSASASSKAISGQATLVIYSERDGVDTKNGAYLTSGICDSDNQFFNEDKQVFNWFYN